MKFLPYEDVPLFIGTEGSVLGGSKAGTSSQTFSLAFNPGDDTETTFNFSDTGETRLGQPIFEDSTSTFWIAFTDDIYDETQGDSMAGWYIFTNEDGYDDSTNLHFYADGYSQTPHALRAIDTTTYQGGGSVSFPFTATSYDGLGMPWDLNSIAGKTFFPSSAPTITSTSSGGTNSTGDCDYIFASRASLSVRQPSVPKRYVDDNKIRICQFGNGEAGSFPFSSPTFTNGSTHTACFGPTSGPPKPLSTSIFKIPKNTKITFPNQKHLYFDHDVFPDGYDYLARLKSTSGSWTLTEGEAQSGYFEPVYEYSTTGPAVGKLDVSFYPGTGNLESFFNITGITKPQVFPPLGEEKITGHLGDFKFSDAYLKTLKFSVGSNAIVNASASFDIYGPLVKDTNLTSNYYNSSGMYQQKSIPHGENSQIIGTSALGINHPVSFSYGINVERVPRIKLGESIPSRVSKKATTIEMSVAGENIDPSLLTDAVSSKRANLTVFLKDLNYQNFTGDNAFGLMKTFNCSGIIESQSLSVGSDGYLNGSISVKQHLR